MSAPCTVHTLKKTSPAFLPKDDDDDYVTTLPRPPRALVTPLIIGRNSNGADFDKDSNEPLDEMENRVRTLTAGDFVENQYFRDQKVADAVVGRAKANAKLIIVLVVVNNAAADDGDNSVTKHGDFLQHLFFKKVSDAFGARCGFFTMTNRAVHSKLMISDDQFIVGGSANCNARSFALDSEPNISVDDKPLTLAFRKRLWAHNLGQSEAAVADASKMISLFQAAVATNAPLDLPAMVGEGIADYDFKKNLGTKSSLISDEFAYMDFDDRMKRRGEGLRPDLEERNNVIVVANA